MYSLPRHTRNWPRNPLVGPRKSIVRAVLATLSSFNHVRFHLRSLNMLSVVMISFCQLSSAQNVNLELLLIVGSRKLLLDQWDTANHSEKLKKIPRLRKKVGSHCFSGKLTTPKHAHVSWLKFSRYMWSGWSNRLPDIKDDTEDWAFRNGKSACWKFFALGWIKL